MIQRKVVTLKLLELRKRDFMIAPVRRFTEDLHLLNNLSIMCRDGMLRGVSFVQRKWILLEYEV